MLSENDLKQIRLVIREEIKIAIKPLEKRITTLELRNEGFDMAIQDIRTAIFNLEAKMNQRFELLETRLDEFILRFDRLNGRVLKVGRVMSE